MNLAENRLQLKTGLLLRAASVGCSGCSPVCKPVFSSGNYDHWDKWDKSGWVRISRISRIRLGPPHGTYPEKGVLILNTYPNGISYRISQLILTYPNLSYICIVYPGKISCIISCNYILQDIFIGYP